MDRQNSSLDRISNLPSIILENILCLVPIKEAVRTSILSKDCRYSWTKIPKLVFTEKDMSDKTIDVFFDAIHQVLSLHTGPILEFSLSMMSCGFDKHVELDQIVSHLARNNDTVKKFTIHMSESICSLHKLPLSSISSLHQYSLHKLPLSMSSLHQLTDLYISGSKFNNISTLSGFGSLTSLYLRGGISSKDKLLHFLSSCPLLKHFELEPGFNGCDVMIAINELFKCLPVIEHLTISTWIIKCDRVLEKLPSSFVHLKYFCLKKMYFYDGFGLRHLFFVIRNSPNLEKIKLEIGDCSYLDGDAIGGLVILIDCSDIWLEHLKELEIVGSQARRLRWSF